MKILVLSSHTPSLFWFRMDMMLHFKELGNEVVVAGPGSLREWKRKFSESGIEYQEIVVERNGLNPLNDFKTLLSLDKLMKHVQPDKIFVYQAKTIAYGCMAAKHNGITEVYPMVAGLGSIFRGNGLKKKIVKNVMALLYKTAFKCSKKVFFQNGDDRDEIINAGLLSAEKVVMVNGSGVNLNKFTVTAIPTQPTFLFIGRLIRDKGIIEYLEACKRIKEKHPQVRCLLVGPYDSNPSALNPNDLGVYTKDNIVEYFGEQKDVRPYISQCGVFVLPSYYEGTPKTVLESMAMGRAIITTDAPGCRETVTDGENGYLVPIKDVDRLYECMEQLINHPEIVNEMGEKGRILAEEKYDVRKINRIISNTMNLI